MCTTISDGTKSIAAMLACIWNFRKQLGRNEERHDEDAKHQHYGVGGLIVRTSAAGSRGVRRLRG